MQNLETVGQKDLHDLAQYCLDVKSLELSPGGRTAASVRAPLYRRQPRPALLWPSLLFPCRVRQAFLR